MAASSLLARFIDLFITSLHGRESHPELRKKSAKNQPARGQDRCGGCPVSKI